MTFKHAKFEDSEVMRSLERVGVEKGIVKVAQPTKSINELVSKSLKPTGNLTQDIIKLCQNLRKEGFDAYASELEKNFIMFKRAESNYQVFKEKGEDLINAAHPDGSHKLEGVSGDSVFETIVDRHLAFLDVVDKKPTGKLASKDISNAIKYALGQETAAPAPAPAPVPGEPETDVEAEEKKEEELDKYRQLFAKKYLNGALKHLTSARKYSIELLGSEALGTIDEAIKLCQQYTDLIVTVDDKGEITGNEVAKRDAGSKAKEISSQILTVVNFINKAIKDITPGWFTGNFIDLSENDKFVIQKLEAAKKQIQAAKSTLDHKNDARVEEYMKKAIESRRPQTPTPTKSKMQELIDEMLNYYNKKYASFMAQINSHLSTLQSEVDSDAPPEDSKSRDSWRKFYAKYQKNIQYFKDTLFGNFKEQLEEYKKLPPNTDDDTVAEFKNNYDSMSKAIEAYKNKIIGMTFPEVKAPPPPTPPPSKAIKRAPGAPGAQGAQGAQADDGMVSSASYHRDRRKKSLAQLLISNGLGSRINSPANKKYAQLSPQHIAPGAATLKTDPEEIKKLPVINNTRDITNAHRDVFAKSFINSAILRLKDVESSVNRLSGDKNVISEPELLLTTIKGLITNLNGTLKNISGQKLSDAKRTIDSSFKYFGPSPSNMQAKADFAGAADDCVNARMGLTEDSIMPYIMQFIEGERKLHSQNEEKKKDEEKKKAYNKDSNIPTVSGNIRNLEYLLKYLEDIQKNPIVANNVNKKIDDWIENQKNSIKKIISDYTPFNSDPQNQSLQYTNPLHDMVKTKYSLIYHASKTNITNVYKKINPQFLTPDIVLPNPIQYIN